MAAVCVLWVGNCRLCCEMGWRKAKSLERTRLLSCMVPWYQYQWYRRTYVHVYQYGLRDYCQARYRWYSSTYSSYMVVMVHV